MSESSHQITDVLLRVTVDPGHNGPLFEFRIDSDKDGYTVSLSVSKLFAPGRNPSPPPPQPPTLTPRPLPQYGEGDCMPSHLTEVLVKERRQVEEFLNRLSTEFNVYALVDLKAPYPFLHPTFYSFSFRDSAGESHSFEYQIECATHLDEKYKKLVQELDSFFESGRVFNKFFAGQPRE